MSLAETDWLKIKTECKVISEKALTFVMPPTHRICVKFDFQSLWALKIRISWIYVSR